MAERLGSHLAYYRYSLLFNLFDIIKRRGFAEQQPSCLVLFKV
ncbi:hypothetical protein CRENPOLYSF2_4410004 [Crenothrix polyspora]|uniref:Uncharacterized protein n=1 Tax=Crenothrix polyspora TaxID=360316 RepID=A0A1R4HFA6_9GAMM|nr:hypothetical protein CRENPOLYSF2_4410004 [Crenothrix polyspora]